MQEELKMVVAHHPFAKNLTTKPMKEGDLGKYICQLLLIGLKCPLIHACSRARDRISGEHFARIAVHTIAKL